MLDADFDPAVLRHVTALKLNEEEVEALGGEERVAELGVPELLLTHGSTGAVVVARGVREHVPVRPDPHLQSHRRRRCLPRRLRLGARGRPSAGLGRAPCGDDRRARARARPQLSSLVIAWVRTVEGVFELDVENEDVLGAVDAAVDRELPELGLPRLVAAAATGATVVALVDRRPPLLDLGRRGATWREAGGGLPPASTSRSTRPTRTACSTPPGTGSTSPPTAARFWRSLAPELPDIEAVAWSTEP